MNAGTTTDAERFMGLDFTTGVSVGMSMKFW